MEFSDFGFGSSTKLEERKSLSSLMNLWESGWQSLTKMRRFQQHNYWLQDEFASSPYLEYAENRDWQRLACPFKRGGTILRATPSSH